MAGGGSLQGQCLIHAAFCSWGFRAALLCPLSFASINKQKGLAWKKLWQELQGCRSCFCCLHSVAPLSSVPSFLLVTSVCATSPRILI